MRVNIKRKVYDTETSKLLNSKTAGEFGDTTGYEEKLYLTTRGLYFVYCVGGADSPYPKEIIKPLTKDEANAWGGAAKSVEKDAGAAKKGNAKKPVKGKEAKAKTPGNLRQKSLRKSQKLRTMPKFRRTQKVKNLRIKKHNHYIPVCRFYQDIQGYNEIRKIYD